MDHHLRGVGEAAANYVLSPTLLADDGAVFRVVVSNWAGTATSDVATLSVQPMPSSDFVGVTGYNWLQLRAGDVTPFIGSSSGVGGSGYGAPSDFRWGDHVWIPNGPFVANGAARYWAGLHFSEPREVENVWVQWWAQSGLLWKRRK